ncbi:MAG: hypothetical protein K5668_10280 [Lachnospiraceae bacterium]|nr:hypothetical protein [Lachnospiraceae bacterium]
MLKLRAPIEIKSRRDFVHDHEGFYDRISGNYSFIGRDIGSEELLHMANTPTEVYLAEGDLTTVSGNTVINSHNEEKLEIINNVLNRIVVSADAHLTYQDRAYITDVLHKIGIKDDRTFMNEVRRIVNESREEDRLINMFLLGNTITEGNRVNNELLNLINRVNSIEERDESLYLAENIMRRLETGAIYQIVSNFNRSVNENSISFNEFAVTGQNDAARTILAERISDYYLREGAELIYRESTESESITEETVTEPVESGDRINNYIYRGGNVYERELLNAEKTDINVTEELGSALFLDIVKNLVSNSFERNAGDSSRWFDFRNVIYNSSENLFRRISFISEEDRVSGGSVEKIYNNTESAAIVFPETEAEGAGEQPADEAVSIERELIRLNEKNLSNVEKYQQMMSLVKSFERPDTEAGGADRTRREALKVLEGNVDLVSMFDEEDTDEEERRDRLFREIVRIFPDNSGEIFNVIENYMDNPTLAPENINVINNNLEEAAEEIRRFQERQESAPGPEISETYERQEELVFRENTTIDMEEIRENIDELRKNMRTRVNRQNDDVISEQRGTETRNIVNTTTTSFTNEELTDIEEMVNRGVRSQMGIISEQVMNKLEKRLRNEKSRRGI